MSASPDVIAAVERLLHGRTRAHALTGERLALEVSARLGRAVHSRRITEAIRELEKSGMAICSLSGIGHWEAQDADEYEWSLGESRRRAAETFSGLRVKERNLLRLRGQTAIEVG